MSSRSPPSRKGQEGREGLLLLAGLLLTGLASVCLILGWLSLRHPGLRFVDFISFAERARRLQDGADLIHPLYPAGYPALLSLLQPVLGDVLIAGRVLSVLAGAGAVLAATRLLGPLAGLWLLAQAPLLRWGSTEGTDLLAWSFCLGALAAARRRPMIAGLLVGMALQTRYQAISAAAVVAVACGRAGALRFVGGITPPIAAHLALAGLSGASPLPDASENLRIALGHSGALLSAETLHRLPRGLLSAATLALESWPARLGAMGLAIGLVRRRSGAWALGGLSGLHLLLIAPFFANPRLVLPATLSLGLAAVWLVPRRWMLALAVPLLAWNLRAESVPDAERRALWGVADWAASRPGPWMSTSPWFHRPVAGWLEPAIPVRAIAANPHAITAAALAASSGFRHLAVDHSRVRRTYPGLLPLLEGTEIPGLRRVARAPGWTLFAIEPVQPAEPGSTP